jgi:hypothetical protein
MHARLSGLRNGVLTWTDMSMSTSLSSSKYARGIALALSIVGFCGLFSTSVFEKYRTVFGRKAAAKDRAATGSTRLASINEETAKVEGGRENTKNKEWEKPGPARPT